MKYVYRGQLNKTKQMVDILSIDIEAGIAKCDHGFGEIGIDDFNCIFIPIKKFKDMIGIKCDKTTPDKIEKIDKKSKKQKS